MTLGTEGQKGDGALFVFSLSLVSHIQSIRRFWGLFLQKTSWINLLLWMQSTIITSLDYSISPLMFSLLPCRYYLYFMHEETKAQRGEMTLYVHSKIFLSTCFVLLDACLSCMMNKWQFQFYLTLKPYSRSHILYCYQECSRTFPPVQERNT